MLKFSGGEDSNYGKSVKKLIEEKQLDRRVYLRGSTRNIADVYAKSDIFATTSTLGNCFDRGNGGRSSVRRFEVLLWY